MLFNCEIGRQRWRLVIADKKRIFDRRSILAAQNLGPLKLNFFFKESLIAESCFDLQRFVPEVYFTKMLTEKTNDVTYDLNCSTSSGAGFYENGRQILAARKMAQFFSDGNSPICQNLLFFEFIQKLDVSVPMVISPKWLGLSMLDFKKTLSVGIFGVKSIAFT